MARLLRLRNLIERLIDHLRKWAFGSKDRNLPRHKIDLLIRNGIAIKISLLSLDKVISALIERNHHNIAVRLFQQKTDLLARIDAVCESIDKRKIPPWSLLQLQTACLKLVGTLERFRDSIKQREEVPLRVSKEAMALAVLSENQHLTNVEIAEKVGVHPKSLYRMSLFKQAREGLKADGYSIPRGEKDGETGTTEAWK